MLSTHIHQDHIDPFFAAAVLKNCSADVPFIGPQGCADLWTKWGVPASRIKVVRPGDTVAIKDVEIVVLELFDRTVLVTSSELLCGQDAYHGRQGGELSVQDAGRQSLS